MWLCRYEGEQIPPGDGLALNQHVPDVRAVEMWGVYVRSQMYENDRNVFMGCVSQTGLNEVYCKSSNEG